MYLDSNENLKLTLGHCVTQFLLLDFWSINVSMKVIQEKSLFKGYFEIIHREMLMDQKPNNKSCLTHYSESTS